MSQSSNQMQKSSVWFIRVQEGMIHLSSNRGVSSHQMNPFCVPRLVWRTLAHFMSIHCVQERLEKVCKNTEIKKYRNASILRSCQGILAGPWVYLAQYLADMRSCHQAHQRKTMGHGLGIRRFQPETSHQIWVHLFPGIAMAFACCIRATGSWR